MNSADLPPGFGGFAQMDIASRIGAEFLNAWNNLDTIPDPPADYQAYVQDILAAHPQNLSTNAPDGVAYVHYNNTRECEHRFHLLENEAPAEVVYDGESVKLFVELVFKHSVYTPLGFYSVQAPDYKAEIADGKYDKPTSAPKKPIGPAEMEQIEKRDADLAIKTLAKHAARAGGISELQERIDEAIEALAPKTKA